jgi:hypothetical protein
MPSSLGRSLSCLWREPWAFSRLSPTFAKWLPKGGSEGGQPKNACPPREPLCGSHLSCLFSSPPRADVSGSRGGLFLYTHPCPPVEQGGHGQAFVWCAVYVGATFDIAGAAREGRSFNSHSLQRTLEGFMNRDTQESIARAQQWLAAASVALSPERLQQTLTDAQWWLHHALAGAKAERAYAANLARLEKKVRPALKALGQ